MSLSNSELRERFASLTTPLVADACMRLSRNLRQTPPELAALLPATPIAGQALPVCHYGSVDVFLAALEGASPGDVLVIDNEGRRDEACIGDLVALEVQAAALTGIVVWGLVRDTAELAGIGLPVYCCGRCPVGPRALRPRPTPAPLDAQLGACRVTAHDVILADDDGVIVVEQSDIGAVLDAATEIARRERAQAQKVRDGKHLRQQFRFQDYLARQKQDPSYTFRAHLARLGGAVEV